LKKDDEQHIKQSAELQSEDKYLKSLRRIKIATLAVIGLIALALSVNIGVHATSTSTFCVSCHMMTPQAHTWEASSHSSIDCADCHIAPGIENTVKAKINGLYELYHTVTDSYGTPIRMKELIPNATCEKCHNMENRNVTTSGDIIVEHQIHDEKEVHCVTCHDGVAHGKVSENRITYRSDFERWNADLAANFMKDSKYVNPQMDKCIDCHELRKAPTTCETCHSTGMIPVDHKEAGFLTKEHGTLAEEDLLSCHSCHSMMSKNPIKELQEQKHYSKYLTNFDETSLTVQQYAKKNTFCADCHRERPLSHISSSYFLDHGKRVGENEQQCLTCHENDRFTEKTVSNISCATCHPSTHSNNNWRQKHPVPIHSNTKYEKSCLSCHVEESCSTCHDPLREKLLDLEIEGGIAHGNEGE
jgi:nitrate/TMAO reductase-like tetraheme cytochrome c subunit